MITLTRVDFTQLSTCSARGTLKLLPFGGHKRQKIVVGTDEMTVVCLSMKNFEIKTTFDTSLSSAGTNTTTTSTAPISSMYVQQVTQKIYAASGTIVSGINKKGKVYYSLKSNMSENIENIQVMGRTILASGEYVLVTFDETGKELHYYMSPDRINDLHLMGDVAVLGCQDSTIRMVHGDTLTFELPLTGAVRSLAELTSTPTRANTQNQEESDGSRRGSFLGRFRKGKKRDKGGGGSGGGGESKPDLDESSKENSAGGKAAGKEQETTTGGEGKHASTDHDDLGASFVYGTMTGGIGAANVVGGVSRKAWFVPPPHSGEAR
jgi:hypothetical protein